MISASDFELVFPGWEEPVRRRQPGGPPPGSVARTRQRSDAARMVNDARPVKGPALQSEARPSPFGQR